MAARLTTELALRIHLIAADWLLVRMGAVEMGRPVKEVRSVIAAPSMAGVGVRQITVVLGVRRLLGAVDGCDVAELSLELRTKNYTSRRD
jgi:hypothetical protein